MRIVKSAGIIQWAGVRSRLGLEAVPMEAPEELNQFLDGVAKSSSIEVVQRWGGDETLHAAEIGQIETPTGFWNHDSPLPEHVVQRMFRAIESI